MLRREWLGAGGRLSPSGAWRSVAAVVAAALLCAAPGRAAGPAPAHLAVALLIDTSGSMTQNDPSGSRVAAARQVAATLRAGDRLGLVGFADTVSILLPLTAMGSPAALAAVDGALGKVGASGATDILGAITTGTNLLQGDANPSDWHVLILVTDGVPDLPALNDPKAAAAYRAGMEAAAQGVAARGWVLDTVGLGGGVDGAELAKLSALGAGEYQFAPSAADLAARLLSEFQAAQQRALTAAPPQAPAPATQISLQALDVRGIQEPGRTVALPVEARNTGATAVEVGLSPSLLPPGWSIPPILTVPPGSNVVALQAVVGKGEGPVRVAMAASVPADVTLKGSTLGWTLHVRSAWRAFVESHALDIGVAGLAVCLLAILSGYVGYLVRVRPLRCPRGRLEITAPGGERLGSLRLPGRPEVTVGAAGARGGVVLVPWIAGEDRLFRIRVEVEAVDRSPWVAGICAWSRPPQAIVYAEAEWPYHLYPGPRPQRRVDLYDHTGFGAGGLTFTFRSSQGQADGGPAGADLLRTIDG